MFRRIVEQAVTMTIASVTSYMITEEVKKRVKNRSKNTDDNDAIEQVDDEDEDE